MFGEQSSIMAVFEAIAEHGEVSRAVLSELTGFSLMTVGKAVDALEKGEIIVQRKQSSGSVGRKMSVCSVNKSRGMLIYDLTAQKTQVRVCDLSLDVRGEYQSEAELSELMPEGFGYFLETVGGELIGIGFVVPDGERSDILPRLVAALGNSPELVIESRSAHAAANMRRFDTAGFAAFIRFFEDQRADCSIVRDGRLYSGAHGRAGAAFEGVGTRAELTERICELCSLLDPTLIHIACEDCTDASDLADDITAALDALGIRREDQPQTVIEPMELCPTAADGAAVTLCEQLIMQKIANNS